MVYAFYFAKNNFISIGKQLPSLHCNNFSKRCFLRPLFLSTFQHNDGISVKSQPGVFYFNSSHYARPISSPYFGGYNILHCGSKLVINQHVLYHATALLKKDESKVEQVVNALKDKEKEEIAIKSKSQEKDSPSNEKIVDTVSPQSSVSGVEDRTIVSVEVKPTIYQRVKDGLLHYYHGFKLLFQEIRVSSRYISKLLNGKSLSRREKKQLTRTTADIFRLVPFLVILLIPFMEFSLPILLKLFPNMLPSTFQEASKEEEKLRTRLKVKLEMAKFLQDTIEESTLENRNPSSSSVKGFIDFLQRARTQGEVVTNEEIVKFSKLFEDEVTLDNLSREQLVAVCQLLDINSLGTSALLRFQLRLSLRQLRYDDKMIQREGVESLTDEELMSASRARGMRAYGLSKVALRNQLSQWLDLNLNNKIPASLLLLSRALYLPEDLSTEDQLKATISSLPDSMATEAKIKVSEVSGEKVDNKDRLERLQKEEEAIALEEMERQEARALEMEKKTESLSFVDRSEPITERSMEQSVDHSIDLNDTIEKEAQTEEQLEIKSDHMERLESVIETVASDEITDVERKELQRDIEEYQEDLEDLKKISSPHSSLRVHFAESKSAQLLSKRVNKLLSQMDLLSGSLQKKKTRVIEGLKEKQESWEKDEDSSGRELFEKEVEEQKKGLLSLNEVLRGMKSLQQVPEDAQLEKIMLVADSDQDGVIQVEEVLKVIELMGEEDVKLKESEMKVIMDLLRKESLEEDRIDKEKENKKKEESVVPK